MTFTPQHLRDTIADQGFAIVEGVLSPAEIDMVREGFESALPTGFEKQRNGSTYALRNVFAVLPAARRLAASPPVRALAQCVLGEQAHPVKALLFDKTPAANWKVAWHQDVTIAVKQKQPVEGYGPWSLKDGVPHVQPPREILEGMLTVRIHLDDCHAANGALKVMPGSHRHGKLNHDESSRLRRSEAPVTCAVPAGGMLLMKPLLLHSSSVCETPSHRRVLHLEYATVDLEGGLMWNEA